jgi:predicted unusual protein kinase regulating ubiquinone biosynthesis (AarF/ABC1/UbiB family)
VPEQLASEVIIEAVAIDETAKLSTLKNHETPSSVIRAFELVDITWNDFLVPVGRGLWGGSQNINTLNATTFWDLPLSSTSSTTVAEQFTTYLERLGVTFVKFGQALSARPDIVPRSLAISLTKLQDRMDVSNSGGLDSVDATRDFLREEFKRMKGNNKVIMSTVGGARMASGLSLDNNDELEEFLSTLSDEPVAAASIGVVYSARLPKSNQKVCIKIQRPNILQLVQQDAELLRVAAAILEAIPSLPLLNKVLPQDPKRPSRLIQTDLTGAVKEFMSRIFEELDYRNECDNIEMFWSLYSHLRRDGNEANFQPKSELFNGSTNAMKNIQVVVPRVYKDLCTEKVLVMEWIEGTKLVDLQRQRQAYNNFPQPKNASSREQKHNEFTEMIDLIKQGIDCTLSQLLDTGILHADPHGGNLLKVAENSDEESKAPSAYVNTKDYRLGYVDFGLLSFVPSTVQEGLVCAVAQLVFARDVSAVAYLFGELQLIPRHVLEDTDERKALAIELERALSQVLVYERESENDATSIPTLRFDKLLDVLSRLVPRFQFQLPPYFLNNARALSTLEGMAREMDPEFNVMCSVYPFAIQRLLSNPTNSATVDATLNSLAESPSTGRLDVEKIAKLIHDASLYSGYSRRKVVRDVLKTKNGKRLLLRLAREQTADKGKRALLHNRFMDKMTTFLKL